ncbi:sugar ABC transporter permease [Ruminococcaceae bacterium OttesenSCG-928-I18]|nr:sugar ABC transporter permease [Ruminococcaceae bacterium OttesenSCG-928-I18]
MRSKHTSRVAVLLILPAVVLILLIIAYPLVYSLFSSFQLADGGWGLDHYQTVLGSKEFWSAFKNTLLFTAGIVSAEIVLGFIVALGLQKLPTHVRNVCRGLMIIPLLISPVIASYEWMWMLNDQYGLVNQILGAIGITPPLWLVKPGWAFFSISLVDIWVSTPFVILVFQSALASLPKEPYEQAELDGASALKKFLYLTLPYLRGPLIVVLIIRTMDVFRIYDAIAVLTGGGPGTATTSLSLLAFRTGIDFGRMQQSSAMSLLMMIPILIVTAFYIRMIFSGEGEETRKKPARFRRK